MSDLILYTGLLADIKSRIRQAQSRAASAANAEVILLYWDIGRMIQERQEREGWGASVIPRLSQDLRNDLPEVKGFSERNIGYMIRFAREYSSSILQQAVAKIEDSAIMPQPVAQLAAADIPANLQQLVAKIPWGHNILLMEKLKELPTRLWYMEQTVRNGWSRETLGQMIRNSAHLRQGAAVTNFPERLSSSQSDLACQLLKDPYIFDFLTLEEPFHERELEVGLVRHLEKFLLELGQGFAFVGRQYLLEVGEKEFYLDLLFYHLQLRCFVVIELKKGEFKPEYAGKLNFYCNVADDTLKHPTDQPTIGLMLCQGKDKVLAEYSLRGIDKPIGVADYELTRALPERLKSVLPTIEEIEAELQMEVGGGDE
jgi:predicted nuclease of restriction endonuclease-like (RecB) superfamily